MIESGIEFISQVDSAFDSLRPERPIVCHANRPPAIAPVKWPSQDTPLAVGSIPQNRVPYRTTTSTAAVADLTFRS